MASAFLFSASTALDSQKGEIICKMGVYRIRVSTGDSKYAGSNNEVYLWLVGQHGEASLGKLLRPCRDSVSCTELGLSCPGRRSGGQSQKNP